MCVCVRERERERERERKTNDTAAGLLLLLCSTQPNSQMASTKGEEGGGGRERWVKKGTGMKVQ